ncbi:MAG: FUSC family protein, partial [Plesiomonas sp.]
MLLQILKATRLTIAILLSFYIAIRLGMHSPGWAITSVLVVSLGTIGEIQAKWWQRIVGNFAGGVAAFFMVWWLAEDPVTIMLAAALFGGVCTYISLTNFLYKDMWRWIIIGFVIVFSASVSQPDKAFPVLFDRVGCVFIGSTIIFVFSALWPLEYIESLQKQYHGLLSNLKDILDKDDGDPVDVFLAF